MPGVCRFGCRGRKTCGVCEPTDADRLAGLAACPAAVDHLYRFDPDDTATTVPPPPPPAALPAPGIQIGLFTGRADPSIPRARSRKAADRR